MRVGPPRCGCRCPTELARLDAAGAEGLQRWAALSPSALERLVQSVVELGELPTPLVRDVGPTWAAESWASAQRRDGVRIPADTYQSLLQFLAAVHGFAYLENFDHFN